MLHSVESERGKKNKVDGPPCRFQSIPINLRSPLVARPLTVRPWEEELETDF